MSNDIHNIQIIGDVAIIRGDDWEITTRLSKMMHPLESLLRDAQDAVSEAQAFARRAERLQAAVRYLKDGKP